MAAATAHQFASSSAPKCSNAPASCSPPLHDAVADVMFRFGLFDGMDESEGSCSPHAAAKAAMKYLFELERAFWFYCDFVSASGNSPKLSLQDFIRVVATLSPHTCEACAAALNIAARDIYSLSAALHSTFIKYKQQIPVCGAYLLNRAMTHVVLIMPWVGKSYQFPKGKTVSGETPRECALREVQEETGIDASRWMLEDSVEVQYKKGSAENNGRVRMFFAVGVSEDLSMSPQVMKEVRAVEWHAIADIEKALAGNGRMQFGAVAPMFATLKDWIACRTDPTRVSMLQRGGRVKFAQHDVDVREYSPVEPPALVRAPGQSPVDPLRPTFVRPSILRRRKEAGDLGSPADSSSNRSTPVPSPLGSPSYSPSTPGDSPSEVRAAPVWPTFPTPATPMVASKATIERTAEVVKVAPTTPAAQLTAAQVFGALSILRASGASAEVSKFILPSFSFNVEAVMAGL